MTEASERRAKCLHVVRCRRLHSAAVRQTLHLHALGRLSTSGLQSRDGGRLQHIPELIEGEIALLSGPVAFSALAARPCAFWLLVFRSARWTWCTSGQSPSHGWQ